MRTRLLVHASMFALALGFAATSCQVVAGLTVLQIDTGGGGQGGTGGGTTTTTTGTGGSPCTKPSECGDDTTCRTFTCKEGTCGSDDAPAGKACSETGGTLCDGKGSCVPPTCMDGFKNGDETDKDCGGSCGKCGPDQACLTTGDCQGSLYCDKPEGAGGSGPGSCKPIRSLGDGCLGTEECGPNFCTDGRCCAVAHCHDGNECKSCDNPMGQCNPLQAGTTCGDAATPCSDQDTCDDIGNCKANDKPADTACNSPLVTDCTLADTCDGAGKCNSNDMPVGTACGSDVDDTCTNPDTCDGMGVCAPNNAADGTSCGGKCLVDTMYGAGDCGAGVCSAQGSVCAGGYACNAAQSACNTMCNSTAECASGNLCLAMMHNCVACGTVPPPPYTCVAGSGLCETCPGSICTKTCDTQNECSAGPIVLGGMGQGTPPSVIDCKGQCNGLTINCMGPAGCSVNCGLGGCNNLILNCDLNGPCKLTCHGNNSCMNAKVSCGDNACDLSCDQPTAVTQTCNSACSCTESGCK